MFIQKLPLLLHAIINLEMGPSTSRHSIRAPWNNLTAFLTSILSSLKGKKSSHLKPFSTPSHVAAGLQRFSVILSLGWIMAKSHEWPNTASIQTTLPASGFDIHVKTAFWDFEITSYPENKELSQTKVLSNIMTKNYLKKWVTFKQRTQFAKRIRPALNCDWIRHVWSQ